jgi:hypothetical protein
MKAYVALLLSTSGGTVAGPVFVRVAGGDGTAGVVAGLLRGVAAHHGAAAQDFLEGAIGGGVAAWLSGLVIRKA